MDIKLSCFIYLVYGGAASLKKYGKPAYATEEEWNFAIAALLAMAE